MEASERLWVWEKWERSPLTSRINPGRGKSGWARARKMRWGKLDRDRKVELARSMVGWRSLGAGRRVLIFGVLVTCVTVLCY